MISICGACGTKSREHASFCHECGTSLEIELIEQSNEMGIGSGLRVVKIPEDVLQDTDRMKEIQKALDNMEHNSVITIPQFETDYTQTDYKTYSERQAAISMLRIVSYN